MNNFDCENNSLFLPNNLFRLDSLIKLNNMRFEFTSDINRSIIKAVVEKKEENHGFRAEGPNPYLNLVHNEVILEKGIKTIHPDLLGLLSMLSFYPFCKDEVTFPMPVSTHFQKAFSAQILPLHEVKDGKYQPSGGITIRNIDHTLERYKGDRFAISFGGGTDSMAVHALFPEAILIHEQSRMANGSIVQDKTVDILKSDLLKTESYSFPNNNRRCIAMPSGWPAWTSCTSNAVLLATDLNIGYIMTGTVLASIMLANGKKFYPPDLTRWNKAYKEIGLNLFSPIWGITEVGTMNICRKSNLLDLTVSCQINSGNECHKCFKCFRKDALRNALGERKFC